MWLFDRALEEWKASRVAFPSPPQLPAPPLDIREQWALGTLAVAKLELGHGETAGNNKGPDIARYCSPHGDGWMWCAGLGGYCIGEAAAKLHIPMLVKKSLSALVLAQNIAAVGRKLASWRELKPGDAMVIKRPGGHHFMLIESLDGDLAHTIEGNHAPKVVQFIRRPDRETVALCATLRLP